MTQRYEIWSPGVAKLALLLDVQPEDRWSVSKAKLEVSLGEGRLAWDIEPSGVQFVEGEPTLRFPFKAPDDSVLTE